MWCVFACQYAGNAAATSPARGGGRLAASSPRSAIARLPSGASPSPGIPPPRAGSAKGGGIPRPAHSVSAEPGYGRRCGARGCLRTLRVRLRRIFPPLRSGTFPAPADSCGAPRPYAARSAVARLGRNTSRLVPPPLQPAPLYHGAGEVSDIKCILRAIKGQCPPLAPIRLSSARLRDIALPLPIARCAERAPQKRTCANSAPADARRERGRSAHGRRDARIADKGRPAATGGIPTKPDAAHGRMRRAPLAARASGGKVTAARKRPRARANRAAHRPRSGTQRCEMHRIGKRPPPNAI